MFRVIAQWFLIIGLMLSFPLNAQLSLPSIGQKSAYILKKENDIGYQFFKRLEKTNKIISDPLVDFYINEIALTLLQGLDEQVRQYRISVIDSSAINAFAVPGGYIGLNTGLILATTQEDQLAGVLAHEIAHVYLQHGMQMVEKQKSLNTATLASLFLALVASQHSDAGVDGELVSGALLASTAGTYQSIINFTRENEYEADRFGSDLMQDAGYSSTGMAELFALLGGDVAAGELSSIEYLRTHPIRANRIGDAFQPEQADAEQNKKPVFKAEDYEFFKAYLAYKTNASYAVNSSQGNVKLFSEAVKELTQNRLAPAGLLLQKLLSKNRDNLWASMLMVEVLTKQNQFNSAYEVIDYLTFAYPEHAFLKTKKVEVLMLSERLDEALALLQTLIDDNKNDHELNYKLAEVYYLLDRPLEAQEAEADYLFLLKQFRQAYLLYDDILGKIEDRNWYQIVLNKKKLVEDLMKHKSNKPSYKFDDKSS